MADPLRSWKTSAPHCWLSSTISATFIPVPSPQPQASAASLPVTAKSKEAVHGLNFRLTRKAQGKTVTEKFPIPDAYGRRSAKWPSFTASTSFAANLVRVSEQICCLQPVPGERHLQRQEVGREVDQLLRAVFNARGKLGGSGSGNHRDGGVIGCRLKQSGMFSMVRGANAILALGCCYLGGRVEDFWEAHRAHLHFCVAHTRGWAQSRYRRS